MCEGLEEEAVDARGRAWVGCVEGERERSVEDIGERLESR